MVILAAAVGYLAALIAFALIYGIVAGLALAPVGGFVVALVAMAVHAWRTRHIPDHAIAAEIVRDQLGDAMRADSGARNEGSLGFGRPAPTA